MELCINLCETTDPRASDSDIADILARTCLDAGFPGCGRVYAGSYFCENYFLALGDAFYLALRALCERYGMGATLVVPIAGQAFLDQVEQRTLELCDLFGDVLDEVVVNDVAAFMWLSGRIGQRLGLGRLFSKGLRDARYPKVFDAVSHPALSPEALSCLQARIGELPLVEVDPTSDVVDVSGIISGASRLQAASFDRAQDSVEIAVHLPFCYATTGRNCSAASIDEPDYEKFFLGRRCDLNCLRMVQGSRVEQGVRYVKCGRTYYYENPGCRIAGADRWRVIYAASSEVMK